MRRNSKQFLLIISVICTLILIGCQQNNSQQDTSPITQPIENSADDPTQEEIQYFVISESNGLFSYKIYNKNHQAVRSVENLTKEPAIIMVNDQIISITTQGGTGIATSSTFYYDIENDLFSTEYQSVLAQYENLVVHATSSSVIVEDIFDPNGLYQEISVFQESFSPVAFPFVKAELEDASSVTITYLAGTEYNEITETFLIKQNATYSP